MHFRWLGTNNSKRYQNGIIFVAGAAIPPQDFLVFIALEGCIGAGKTTVARGLAHFRRAQLMEENFELNPFLRAFYSNPGRYALETEFTFLLMHFHQLHDIVSPGKPLISDFMFDKDLIYAGLNFSGNEEKVIFSDLQKLLACRLSLPDLVIFLSVSDELVIERIRKRQRTYELEIDAGYYKRLNEAYETFFQSYERTPLLRVEADQCDFVKNPSLFASLSKTADEMLVQRRVRASFLL